jgi:concentrative nucleoside transporter, CNT family
MASLLQSLFGFAIFMLLAWGLSEDRSRVAWRTVVAGVALEFILAVLLLKLPVFKSVFLALNDVMFSLDEATRAGTSFVFGYLGGAPLPFSESAAGSSFVLAFRALPLVLIVSALSALLFYWRVLPVVIQAFSRVLQRVMGIGGAVGVSAAAEVFVGMVEAPLLIRPYLMELTRAELFMVMSCGMATIAGTVMVLYASLLAPVVPDAMGHILSASLISVPAALTLAALMVPPQAGEATAGALAPPEPAKSSMDAITRGTLQGVTLLLNIVAMLIVLVALVSLLNQVLGLLPQFAGKPLTLERLFGWLMAPLTWLMGIPWREADDAGRIMGIKTALNELLAYSELARLPEEALSPRSRLIMTYALCGFANFGSLGILIGGLSAMVPERRTEIVGLGLKSIVSGTLATSSAGAIVGMLNPWQNA